MCLLSSVTICDDVHLRALKSVQPLAKFFSNNFFYFKLVGSKPRSATSLLVLHPSCVLEKVDINKEGIN